MSPQRRYDVDVHASLEDVWAALTTADGLRSWFVVDAKVVEGVGGEVYLDWGLGQSGSQPITAWEPMSRLCVAWGPPPDADADAVVDAVVDAADLPTAEEFLLSHDHGVTHVRVVMSLPGEWTGQDDLDRGWALFLANLRFFLEQAGGRTRTTELRHANTTLDRDAAWAAVTDALGLPRTLDVGAAIEIPGVGPATVAVSFTGSVLLTAGDDTTVLLDLEGDPATLLLYGQAATHGPDDPARVARRQAATAWVETAC